MSRRFRSSWDMLTLQRPNLRFPQALRKEEEDDDEARLVDHPSGFPKSLTSTANPPFPSHQHSSRRIQPLSPSCCVLASSSSSSSSLFFPQTWGLSSFGLLNVSLSQLDLQPADSTFIFSNSIPSHKPLISASFLGLPPSFFLQMVAGPKPFTEEGIFSSQVLWLLLASFLTMCFHVFHSNSANHRWWATQLFFPTDRGCCRQELSPEGGEISTVDVLMVVEECAIVTQSVYVEPLPWGHWGCLISGFELFLNSGASRFPLPHTDLFNLPLADLSLIFSSSHFLALPQ